MNKLSQINNIYSLAAFAVAVNGAVKLYAIHKSTKG